MRGPDWMSLFIKRHKLKVREADNVKPARGKIARDDVELFYSNVANVMYGVPEKNIINFDETNFTDDPKKEKV